MFDSRKLRSSTFNHSHIQIALTLSRLLYLRVVLKPENMSLSAQATQISYTSFVCTLHASSTLPLSSFQSLPGPLFFARFDRCLNIFQSITQPWSNVGKLFRIWKTCHRAHKQHKLIPVRFVCTLPFYCRFRSLIDKNGALELNYFWFETFYLLCFLESASLSFYILGFWPHCLVFMNV